MSNDSLLARAAALAQRQGTPPPAGSDVANYMSRVSAGADTSGRSVVAPNARPGYTADQSMSRALGLMGNVTRGFTGSLTSDPVSQLRALPGGERVATPETTGLSRFDMFRDAISREASNSLGSLDSVMRAINIPIMDRVTLRSAGGAKNAPGDQDRVDFSRLVNNRGPAQFASDFPLSSSSPVNTSKGISAQDWTIPSNEQWRMTQDFNTHGERAIDVRANQGSAIPAPVFGKVVATDKDYPDYHWSYGNMVVIEDSEGRQHLIAHMDGPANYNVGDVVRPGDIVGAVGNTGRYVDEGGGGYHVHYEVFDPQGGQRFDPTPHAQGYFIPLY